MRCTEGCTKTHAQSPFAAETTGAGAAENKHVRNGWKISVSRLGENARKFLADVGARLGRIFSFSKPAPKPAMTISAPTGFVHHKNAEIQLASLKNGMSTQGASAPEGNVPPAKPPRMDPVEAKRIADLEAARLAAEKPAPAEEPEEIFGSSAGQLFSEDVPVATVSSPKLPGMNRIDGLRAFVDVRIAATKG